MHIIRNSSRALLVSLWLAVSPLAQAQSVLDWLTFTSAADRASFSLTNDAGSVFATGHVNLISGVFAPLSPSAGVLQSPFWTMPPPFADSLLGDRTLQTTRVQVAPQSGSVTFQLDIRGGDLSQLVFAVGQIFGAGEAVPREMPLFARTISGALVPLEFLGTSGWDNGLRAYTQPLIWDGAKLSLAPNVFGESAFAFFRIGSTSEAITQLLFDVPNGYALGNGDALEFAFGVPVPEPSAIAMLLVAFGGFALLSNVRRGRVS